jgi:predicted TIM-barrel fold metal-dependent hydrolase
MSSEKPLSRRNFIAGTGLILAGATLSAKAGIFKGIGDEPIIDIHQHTDFSGRTQEQLLAHQRAMGISTTILLPAGRPLSYGSTYYGVANGLQVFATGNEVCRDFARQYPKEFIAGANEVPDFPDAVEEIEKYLKMGAPIIGESKFGLECDSPAMQKIYELAAKYDVPILMHFEYNMYNRGFERMHKMLKKYPKTKIIAHAMTWWANVDKNYTDINVRYPKGKITPGGITEKMLADYPNLIGDLSGNSGLAFLKRDDEYVRWFLERFQDKLVYGSDCSDHEGTGATCSGWQAIVQIRKLSPSKEVERKLLYYNTKKLLKLDI